MPHKHLDNLHVKERWKKEWEACTIADKIKAVELYPEIKDSFIKYIDKDEMVLEAGCGFGGWVNYLSENGYHVVGLDYLDSVINKVKHHLRSDILLVADVDRLPFKDNVFGSYLSFGVVEHIEVGPEYATKEAMRVTKPEGVIFISVPYKHIVF